MDFEAINPEQLEMPIGYAHGVLCPAGGRLLLVSGQYGTDRDGRLPQAEGLESFLQQYDWALQNVLDVVRTVGGGPESIARLRIYVKRAGDVLAGRDRIAQLFRARMGPHQPAMTTLEVSGFLRPLATIRIEAEAVLTDWDLEQRPQ